MRLLADEVCTLLDSLSYCKESAHPLLVSEVLSSAHCMSSLAWTCSAARPGGMTRCSTLKAFPVNLGRSASSGRSTRGATTAAWRCRPGASTRAWAACASSPSCPPSRCASASRPPSRTATRPSATGAQDPPTGCPADEVEDTSCGNGFQGGLALWRLNACSTVARIRDWLCPMHLPSALHLQQVEKVASAPWLQVRAEVA